MKFYLTPLLLLAIIFSSSLNLTYAQTPTSGTTIEEIQKIREVIQQKVKDKLQEINQTQAINPKKAYVGVIAEINDNILKINAKDKVYDFTISDDATFVSLKLNKIKITDLKVGQNVLVLSLAKDDLVYAKKVILVDPATLENKKNVSVGKLADISTTTSVLILIPINNKNRELQIKVDSKTDIITRDNKKLKFSDLKKGQKITCIYTNGQNSTYPALQIITLD